MRSSRYQCVVPLLLAATTLWAGNLYEANPGEQVAPNQLIVRMKPGVAPSSVIPAYIPGVKIRATNLPGVYLIHAPGPLAASIAKQLAQHPLVDYVEPNRIRHTSLAAPNDPNYSNQWGLATVRAIQAASLMPAQYLTAATAGTGRVKVAVLDTGADCTHPDFVNTGGSSTDSASGGQLMWSASQALVATTITNPACAWQDDYGHGTHVAGIVAAATSNNAGVASLGYPLQVIVYKVLDSTGNGDDVTVMQAIMAAVAAGAQVVSMSFTSSGYSQTMQLALNYAWQNNVITVAAAGNDATSTLYFPAGGNHAVGVSASDQSNNLAYFSNFGNGVSLAAPGYNIVSTLPTYSVPICPSCSSYGYLSGTSMSTPFVSALAGLLAMANPGSSATAIVRQMEQTADSSVTGGGWGQNFGYGIIDAYNAISNTVRPATTGGVVGQIIDTLTPQTSDPITGAIITINGTQITTDASGLFRFSGLSPGTYSVSATASGFPAQALTVTVTSGADTPLTVEMGVSYGHFSGTVTDQSQPVPGAVIQALASGLIVASAIADANGNYSLWVPADGTSYVLQASAIGKVTSTSTGMTVPVGGNTVANLVLPRMGNIAGNVHDSNANPVPGAQIFVSSTSFSASTTTDSNGNYSLFGLPVGTYSVTASILSFTPVTQPGTVTVDATDVVNLQFPVATVVNAPAFTPPGGTFTNQVPISLSSTTGGASIRYTVDGSTPSETNGTLYNGAISVSGTSTIKAIAYATGLVDSVITSATYTINSSPASWYNNSWAHRKQITISLAQVAGGLPLTNFPMLYSVAADANLAAEAQTNANDILFTLSDGVTKLNHQIESYNPSTGQLLAWVQIPSLSPTGNPALYIYYGNPIAANQQNPTGVWDSTYSAVWHFPNGTMLSAADSTANANNGSISSPVASSGEFYGAASFNGASDGIGFNPIANLAQTYTAEFWMDSNFPNAYMSILGGTSAFNDIYFDGSGNVLGIDNGTSFGAYSTVLVSGLNVPSGAWTSLAVTRSGSTVSVYKNGALIGTGTFGTPYNVANFAEMGNAGGINHYGGKLDEVRISSSARSAAWIRTEFNNQSSPVTFFSLGNEQTVTGGGSTVAITVTTSPTGLALAIDGSPCSAPCNFQWTTGANHTIAVTTSPQAGTTGTQYVYSSWSDGMAQSHSITVPSSPATYTASFTTQFMLTTSANPPAGGTISPASGWYNSGSPVQVTETANSGYNFAGFTGTTSSGSTQLSLTMTAPMTETANFSAIVTGPGWYNTSWPHRKQITIAHGQVAGGSALTSFPILYSTATDANLAAEALANGNDILFTASDGVTKLNHQVETYNSTTGQLIAWVQIPALSNSADTVMYIYYGNAGATNQQNPTAVWDSNYAAVWHLPNGTTLSAADSTANGNNGTISSPTATAGEINGGASFNGTSDGISFSPVSALAQTYTAEFWMNSSFPHAYMTILGGTSAFNDIYFDGSSNVLGVDNGTSWVAYSSALVTGLNVAANTWTSLAITRSGSSISIYKNGTLVGSGTFSTPYNTANFAEMGSAGGINYYGGKLDEVRISSSARSAAWIQTEYNNQSSPTTFLSISSEQSNGTPGTVATPTFSVPGGTYTSTQSVSIGTTTSGASIRYTTNGTPPSETVGTPYSGSVTVSASETLMAIAYETGFTDSAVASASYIINTSSGPSWYNNAWAHRKPVTIAHGQVSGGSALTNFPLLYSVVTDANLAAIAQASGNDILFTASDGVTKLNHQIETYNSTTGQLIAWVQIPALSNSADTVIYMYYGNAGASNQQNPATVWDSNYAAVWHLPNGTTLSAADSTANGNNGTISSPTATAGEINGGASFNGTSDGISFSPISSLTQTYTAEFWMNSSFPHAYMTILGGTSAFNDIYFDGSSNVLGVDNGTSWGAYSTALVSGLTVPSNTWTSLAVTRSGSTISVYKNGTLVGSGTFSTPYNTANFAEMGSAGGINYYGGKLDEVRISSNVRTSGWIQTEYNNQSSPATFLSVGAQQ